MLINEPSGWHWMARLDGWAHGYRTEAARYGELLMVPPVAKKSEKKYDDDANFERPFTPQK